MRVCVRVCVCVCCGEEHCRQRLKTTWVIFWRGSFCFVQRGTNGLECRRGQGAGAQLVGGNGGCNANRPSACLAAGAQASMYLAPLLPPACLSACQHVCQHVSMSGRGSASGYVSSPTVCPSTCAQNQHPKLEKERVDSELVRKIRVRAHTYKKKKTCGSTHWQQKITSGSTPKKKKCASTRTT